MKSLRSVSPMALLTFAVIAAAALLMPAEAYAAGSVAFLESACEKVNDVWTFGKTAIYVIAGVGILVLAVFAFAGRFKWSHLFALAGGVIMVATASELIQWLAGGGGQIAC